jgi:hypothetical protein
LSVDVDSGSPVKAVAATAEFVPTLPLSSLATSEPEATEIEAAVALNDEGGNSEEDCTSGATGSSDVSVDSGFTAPVAGEALGASCREATSADDETRPVEAGRGEFAIPEPAAAEVQGDLLPGFPPRPQSEVQSAAQIDAQAQESDALPGAFSLLELS